MTPQVASIFAMAVLQPQPEKEESLIIFVADKKGYWFQKLRLIATVKAVATRWKDMTKAKTRRAKAEVRNVKIAMSDIKDAEKDLVRAIQKESYQAEIDQLIKAHMNY